MCAKQHLGELLVDTGQFDEAIAVFEHMLDLNSDDNQGMRYNLVGLYLATGRTEALERLMSRYDSEQSVLATWPWAHVGRAAAATAAVGVLHAG